MVLFYFYEQNKRENKNLNETSVLPLIENGFVLTIYSRFLHSPRHFEKVFVKLVIPYLVDSVLACGSKERRRNRI